MNPRAKWHDGHPVTVEDVVFTLQYFQQHPYRWITLEHVDHASAQTPHSVVITLSRPYAPFLSEIGGTMPIIPRHVWEKVDQPESCNAPQAFVGSGPCVFRDFDKTQGT